MLFNSIDFAIFLPIVFFLYWFVFNKSLKLQNLLIVFASYLFYGWWDWRFLSLIFFSSVLDYIIGLGLLYNENQTKRKVLLATSIIVNLGFLGFFKYYNFFLENFTSAFSLFGIAIKSQSLNIILPVGISFYTFQTMSYSIDVYKGNLQPTKNFIDFSAFVSFFPQLVAGPIERATNLLPQFYQPRTFDYSKSVDGMRQILWGLFKKMVIADNCAQYANMFFNDSSSYPGSALALGAIFFTFQIYGDFSGYSDIAIGTSRLFGFDLMQNFNFPYFSRDIAEFWRRWHISLSTWFRDYLYIPLGGSKGSMLKKVRNTFIIFIVSGFWHGANWTFIIWGALNAFFIMPSIIFNKNRNNLNTVAAGKKLPSIKELIAIVFTFSLTVLAWIFFRSENVTHAAQIIKEIASASLFTVPEFNKMGRALSTLVLVILLLLIEWQGREGTYALSSLDKKLSKVSRWIFYAFLVFLIGLFMQMDETPFIYFQF